jgi:hypothetical protein
MFARIIRRASLQISGPALVTCVAPAKFVNRPVPRQFTTGKKAIGCNLLIALANGNGTSSSGSGSSKTHWLVGTFLCIRYPLFTWIDVNENMSKYKTVFSFIGASVFSALAAMNWFVGIHVDPVKVEIEKVCLLLISI